MRIRFLVAAIAGLMVFKMNGISQPPIWFVKLKREIKLLESDRKDFERSFSDASVVYSFPNGRIQTVMYQTQFGEVEVTYSGGDCEKYYDYRVRKDTIIRLVILLPPENRPRFKRLKIDTTGFQTTREDDGTFLRVDPASGYSYSTQRKRLSSLLIEPTVSQNLLRCSTKTESEDRSDQR